MEDFFDVGEVLYQKFLLDIYRHCDKLAISHIPASEKEKMAVEMVDFVGKVVKSLESKRPIVPIESVNKKNLKKLSELVSNKVNNDIFSQSVVKYYISNRKIKQTEISSYLTIAAIAVLSKGKKIDAKLLETKIVNAKPYVFRVASLLSPAVCLHDKIFNKMKNSGSRHSLAEQRDFDINFEEYIG